MPRSFLVKQLKVHDASCSNYYPQESEGSYTVTYAIRESASNLAVRLSENGESTWLPVCACVGVCLCVAGSASIVLLRCVMVRSGVPLSLEHH